MPSRLLREGIIDSDAVNALSPRAEVFYRRLMSVVDDFGRFDGRPAVLRSRLYPLQLDSVREADIPRWIAECEKAGLVRLYVVNSKQYLLFYNLGAPRAKESKYPAPPPGLGERPPPNLHLHTDVNGCAQTLADAPYSYSSSDSNSGSDKTPLPPAEPGGADGDYPAIAATGSVDLPPPERKEPRPRRVPDPPGSGADPPEPDIVSIEPFAALVEAWTAAGLPGAGKIQATSNRRGMWQMRLAETSWRERWREGVERAGRSARCRGLADPKWSLHLDTFLRHPDMLVRILEGEFDDARGGVGRPAGKPTVGEVIAAKSAALALRKGDAA
jgi:hypothetical protein